MAFDLDAFIRSREPFTFTFGGREWTWPPNGDLRADVALARGDLGGALRWLFDDEQAVAFMEAGHGLDVEALRALFDAYAEHRGTRLGESSASSASSKPTAKRSRQTSKSTTASRSKSSAKS